MKVLMLRQLAWISLIVVGLSVHPAFATMISIQPPTATPVLGSSFDLSIDIADVVDLYAFQFDIGFDPLVLSAQSITEGSFLSDEGPTFFIPGVIDNGAGTIAFTGNSLIGPILGATGNGSLATIHFKALAFDSSAVNLSRAVLLDAGLKDIVASTANSNVEVTNQTSVPEPASLILLSIGLAGMSAIRRRCWKA